MEPLSRIATQALKSLKSERPDFSTGVLPLSLSELKKETDAKASKLRAHCGPSVSHHSCPMAFSRGSIRKVLSRSTTATRQALQFGNDQ